EAKLFLPKRDTYLRSLEQRLEAVRALPDDADFGRTPSKYFREAVKLSGPSDYWKQPTELFARAFESWVQDRVEADGSKSQYLVHGSEEGRYAGGEWKGNPYPEGEDRARIAGAMERLAAAIAPEAEREMNLASGGPRP